MATPTRVRVTLRTDGSLLGNGSLVHSRLVLMDHRGAAWSNGTKVRCKVGGGALVDGDVVVASTGSGAPAAVRLASAVAGPLWIVPGASADKTPAQNLAAAENFSVVQAGRLTLVQRAALAEAFGHQPVPALANGPHNKPWYCMVWHTAFGCN